MVRCDPTNAFSLEATDSTRHIDKGRSLIPAKDVRGNKLFSELVIKLGTKCSFTWNAHRVEGFRQQYWYSRWISPIGMEVIFESQLAMNRVMSKEWRAGHQDIRAHDVDSHFRFGCHRGLTYTADLGSKAVPGILRSSAKVSGTKDGRDTYVITFSGVLTAMTECNAYFATLPRNHIPGNIVWARFHE